MCVCAQSCPTLWDSMVYSPPGSSAHGIFQVRILEWVAISYSSRSTWLRDWTLVSWVSCIGRWIVYQLCHLGSPVLFVSIYNFILSIGIIFWMYRHINKKFKVLYSFFFIQKYNNLFLYRSDPMDCSLPGSSVHGIFQARVLEWGAIAFSHDSSRNYIY